MDGRMTVAVYGATGHTGRFVIAELERRGLGAIRIGRDAARLAQGGNDAAPWRVASADDPAALDAALRRAHAVINCAGPTSIPRCRSPTRRCAPVSRIST
ncbi:NAD(P)H-binding protein [Burkholderia ambifaria]|uniref:NAD(P)H-binding protein n=1 Tax=Burkholderia ambifaria TaxID=152480 RepID=UPI00315C4C64